MLRQHYVHEDVKKYLENMPAEYFNLVIMDPPTFSNSKRMKDFLDIQRDHPVFINQTIGTENRRSAFFQHEFQPVSSYRLKNYV